MNALIVICTWQVAFLKSQAEVQKRSYWRHRLVHGWRLCAGRGTARTTLAADVINYGELQADPDDLKKIKAPT